MEPIGDHVRDVLLCEIRWVADDLFSSGLVVISPLLRDPEPPWLGKWEDAAGPGC
jgi:hypothetical protein